MLDKIEIKNRMIKINGKECHSVKSVSINATNRIAMEVTVVFDADLALELSADSECEMSASHGRC